MTIQNTGNNIILITVDSLRQDHLGCYGYSENTSENIDALADNGILYENAIANGPYTSPSFTSIFSSQYPLRYPEEVMDLQEVNPIHYFSSNRTSFVSKLQEIGFDTAGFVDENPYISSKYNFNRGFDTFNDFIDAENEGVSKYLTEIDTKIQQSSLQNPYLFFKYNVLDNTPGQGATTITDHAISWLDDRTSDNPFFLWIHYMDPHSPWLPNGMMYKRWKWAFTRLRYHNRHDDLSQSELNILSELYDKEIEIVDREVGRLMNHLKNNGKKDDTYVMLASDHGTGLGEYGKFGHTGPYLYQELLDVPLIIDGADLPDTNTDLPVQLMDIGPTIFDLLDINDTTNMRGASLVREPIQKSENSRPILSERFSLGKHCISVRDNSVSYRINYDYRSGEITNERIRYIHSGEQKQKEVENNLKNIALKHISEIRTSIEKQNVKRAIYNLHTKSKT